MARRFPARPLQWVALALALLAPLPAGAGPYGLVRFGGYLPTGDDFQGETAGFAFEAGGGIPLGPVLALELGAAVYQMRADVTNASGARYRAPIYGLMVPLSLQLSAPVGASEVEPYLEAGVSWHRVDLDGLDRDHDSTLGYHAGAGLCLQNVLVSVRWFEAKVDLLDAKGLRMDGFLLTVGLRVGRPHPPRPGR